MANKKLNKRNVKLQSKKRTVSFVSFFKVVKFSVIALLVLGAAGASAYYGNQAFKQFLSKPIASVAIEGDFFYMSKEAIANTINGHIQGSFIRESLNKMQEQIQENPWIDGVVLRRQWPDKLLVTIVEQKPIARWGDYGFVNYRGELIKVNDGQMIEGLPVLRGDEKNAMTIMKQYQVLSQAISPYGINITELSENQLGIWTLRLDNEWELLVGRTNIVKKIQQLMQITAENKIPSQDDIMTIDMRYEQGLAIRWKDVEQHAKQDKIQSMSDDEKNI